MILYQHCVLMRYNVLSYDWYDGINSIMAAELSSASGNWWKARTYGVYVQKAHLS